MDLMAKQRFIYVVVAAERTLMVGQAIILALILNHNSNSSSERVLRLTWRCTARQKQQRRWSRNVEIASGKCSYPANVVCDLLRRP